MPGTIVASTYRNLNDFVIPMLTTELWEKMGAPGAWDELIAGHNKQDQIIVFKNGSRIYLRSCDRPDDLRGPNLGFFFVDEAAKVPHKVWKLMVARLRRPPERGWITTTPRGRNWVWEEFAKEIRPNYSFVTGSTTENKFLSQEYIDSLMESYSGSFLRQEVYGEFVGWEGLVYQLDLERHHADSPPPGPGTAYKYALAGCDWGWIDPSVIVIGLVGHDGWIHLVDEFYQNKTPIQDVAYAARHYHDKWGVRTYWCDPSRPEYLQEFRNEGLDARKGNRELDPGIATVDKYLRDGMLFVDFNRCPNTVAEFETYQYEEDDMGTIMKNRPIDKFNHAMDGVRYMIYSHSKVGYVGTGGSHR